MILDGTVNFAEKNLYVENPFNLPRQLTAMVNASVTWTHNPPTDAELKRGPVVIGEMMNFVPEVGETSMTAFYQTCQRLATQIVDMMETPWAGGDTVPMPAVAPGTPVAPEVVAPVR